MSTLIVEQLNLKPQKKVTFNNVNNVKVVVIDMKHHKHKLTTEQIKKLSTELEEGCCIIM